MEVTYTHTNGNITVLTANTAVQSNFLLGTSTPQTSPADIEELDAIATEKTIVGNVTYYYRNTTTYSSDFGISIWASEQLTPAEFAEFEADSEVWMAEIKADPTIRLAASSEKFNYWWDKFTHHANVKIK
jgi:hypothetical protein